MTGQKEEKKQKRETPRCVKCNSTFGYFKIKDREWQCRCCGFVEKKEEKA